MAVSGNQLTRIGAFFSGLAKKLNITAKAEKVVSLGPGAGYSSTMSNDGLGLGTNLSNDGMGQIGLMSNDGIGLSSNMGNNGIGEVG